MKLRDLTPDQLGRLNSATKYPSIPTYHVMGERGRLTDEVAVTFDSDDELVVTEKIDGTNVRVIFTEHDFIIGSREELLHASGDLIHNPQLGIVEALQDRIEPIREVLADLGAYSKNAMHQKEDDPGVDVVYGELYGGNIGRAAKQYGSDGTVGFRVFDVTGFSRLVLTQLLDMERSQIAHWRQMGNQHFWSIEAESYLCKKAQQPTVPELPAKAHPPSGIAEALQWMDALLPARSAACIDKGALGQPEGVIVRTPDRSKIAKLRIEDYRRTLRTLELEES